METKEICIPVPWGHIAAVTWGNSNDPPIVAVHGFTDNAGAFDLLIPQLPQCFYYICIDLPGHGKSTHLPGNTMYNTLDFVVALKILVDHFSLQRFILMGHSVGGRIAIRYLQTYSSTVQKLILIDSVYGKVYSPEKFAEKFKSHVYMMLKAFQKKEVRKFSYEEALDVASSYRYGGGTLRPEVAQILLKRGLLDVGMGKFQFSADPRLKFTIGDAGDADYAVKVVESLAQTCPVLILLATTKSGLNEEHAPVVEKWKENKFCAVKYVAGQHDLHMANVEKIVPLISEFLLSPSKL